MSKMSASIGITCNADQIQEYQHERNTLDQHIKQKKDDIAELDMRCDTLERIIAESSKQRAGIESVLYDLDQAEQEVKTRGENDE